VRDLVRVLSGEESRGTFKGVRGPYRSEGLETGDSRKEDAWPKSREGALTLYLLGNIVERGKDCGEPMRGGMGHSGEKTWDPRERGRTTGFQGRSPAGG